MPELVEPRSGFGGNCRAAAATWNHSIRNDGLITAHGRPGAIWQRPGGAFCGRKGRSDPGAVHRPIHQAVAYDSTDIPAVLAKDLVLPDTANHLARLAVEGASRNLKRS